MADRGHGTLDDHRRQPAPDYDFSSRHIIAARLVEVLVPRGSRVLDIGGAGGMAVDLLSGYEVTVADVIDQGVDVVASGTDLPFRDSSFDLAVSLDVLEHVDSQQKPRVIAEAMRVADSVVLAGPFDDEGVRQAEMVQREYYQAMSGHEHRWLAEHLESGLPVLDAVLDQFKSEGFRTHVFGSNPLALWSELRFATHFAEQFSIDEETWALRRDVLESFLDQGDATAPSYRHFVVGARDRDISEDVDNVKPGTDEAATLAALALARRDTGRIIGVAGSGVPELRAHAHNLEAGMEELHKELAVRLDIIEGLVDERDGLQRDLTDLREAVARDPLSRRLVNRRLRRR